MSCLGTSVQKQIRGFQSPLRGCCWSSMTGSVSWEGKQLRSYHQEPFTDRFSQAFYEICLTLQVPFDFTIQNQLGVGLMTLGVRRAGFPFCPEVTQSTAVKPAAVDEPDQHSQNRHSRKNNTWIPHQLLQRQSTVMHHDERQVCLSSRAFSLVSNQRQQALQTAEIYIIIIYLYYTCLLRKRHKVTSHHGNTHLFME